MIRPSTIQLQGTAGQTEEVFMQAERLSAYKAAPAAISFRRATVNALCWMYDWGNRVAWVAAALSVPFFLYVAVYVAPAEQRIAQQQERDAIERENIAFCEKHGMLVGTREYGLCAEDLTNIRTKQSQRTAAEMERTF
jgi:hypothetical protein